MRGTAKVVVLSPSGLNRLLEMRFKFPLNLTGKSTMANHSVYSNPGTQVGAQNKGFSAV